MFQIKICGVTQCDDALAIVAAGADAIGLNFYARSPRFVDVERACAIVESLPSEVKKVGVFVNASSAEIERIAREVGLDVIQLHGDEPPEMLAELTAWPVVKAFRGLEGGLDAISRFVEQSRTHVPKLILLDAAAPSGEYGGSGRVVDWLAAAEYRRLANLPPLILAGGLKPENVAEAIRLVRPWGVDTASGVESSPGHKDAAKVHAFVKVSRETLN